MPGLVTSEAKLNGQDILRKVIDFEIKEINEEERSFEAVGSTETRDRDGDIIRAQGWQLANYKKNPVILWAHRYDEPAIAKAENIRIEDTKLKFKAAFPPVGTNPRSDVVYAMAQFMKRQAFSVGFIPIKHQQIDGEEGKSSPWGGKEYLKQELLENSAVPVPSNPDAIAHVKGLGLDPSVLEIEGEWIDADPRIEGKGTQQPKGILKPEPDVTDDYIRIRVKAPGLFKDDSFRTIDINKKDGIKAVAGKLKDPPEGQENSMVVQSYLFDKEKWTVSEAQQWVKDHQKSIEAWLPDILSATYSEPISNDEMKEIPDLESNDIPIELLKGELSTELAQKLRDAGINVPDDYIKQPGDCLDLDPEPDPSKAILEIDPPDQIIDIDRAEAKRIIGETVLRTLKDAVQETIRYHLGKVED